MKPPRLLAIGLAGFLAFTAAGQDAPASRATDAAPDHGRRRNVAVLVWDGVELLDFAGPIEAFSSANGWDTAFRVFTVTGGPARQVRTRNVATVVADYTVADCPPADILVIPGGETRCLGPAYPLGKLILEREPKTEVVFSVCNGVFALANAGLLDGLEATTHRIMIGFLRKAAPKTVVHADRRFVDNGHIVTAAGVSAGIDGALHLIDRFTGPENAASAARRMQYELPGGALTSRPAGDRDRARRLWYAGKWKDALKEYEAIAAARPSDTVALARLGTCLLFTGRNEEAVAALTSAIRLGSEDDRALHALAIAHARLGHKAESLEALERAFEREPSSFEVMRELGEKRFEAGDHAGALPLIQAAFDQGMGDAQTLGRIARVHAMLGHRAEALAALRLIEAEGNPELANVLADPAFEKLGSDPDLSSMRERAASSRAAKPR